MEEKVEGMVRAMQLNYKRGAFAIGVILPKTKSKRTWK